MVLTRARAYICCMSKSLPWAIDYSHSQAPRSETMQRQSLFERMSKLARGGELGNVPRRSGLHRVDTVRLGDRQPSVTDQPKKQ